MEKPDYHILVCNSFRVSGEAQGVCNKKGAAGFLPYLEEEIIDRGLSAQVTACGCLKVCDRGPAMVIYPQGYWYGDIDSEDKLDQILDALEEGEAVEDLLIS
ncbi:MAG: (2Fe-2S) ferredoxin domain-containing protein [Planctomycetes bacterium]|nr:(2Fe-2S) ferredoxin domain-containing protein [Planctomycetota bacterium]